MALCTDDSLTYLNGIGYNVIRLPRRGIDPLDVLGRDGKSLERLGRLDQIWASSKPVPIPGGSLVAAKISGQRTSELSLSIGLKMLSNVLAAIGAKMPNLDFAYSQASTLQFTFESVTTRGVDAFAVGEYLGAGDLRGPSPVFDRYFLEEDTEAFVITEVLESTSISVTAKDDSKSGIKVDMPAIQNVVGAAVTIDMKAGSGSDLTFSGTEPVTFGFKAFQIAFAGRWRVVRTEPGPDLAFSLPAQLTGEAVPVLLRRGGTVVLRASL